MEKSTHTREYAILRAELRAARERAGLTQRELATRLKVPHSWIAKVETGERRIDFVEFCWFVAACGEEPNYAFERLTELMREPEQRRQMKGGRHK